MDVSPKNKYYKLIKPIYVFLRFKKPFSLFFKYTVDPIKTYLNIVKNSRKSNRQLEIGADFRIPAKGFETLSLEGCVNIDYVLDASKRLPFKNGTFSLIYASHVLEHIPWYFTEKVLQEWKRILKPGGVLEVWVPDGLKICKNLVNVEVGKKDNSYLDNYYKLVPNRDPRLWASLRIFTFGDGKGTLNHPNWHRALFTPSLLKDSMEWSGFSDVKILNRDNYRGRNHGWIDLGVQGVKK